MIWPTKMSPQLAHHIACIAYFRLSENLQKTAAKPSEYEEWLQRFLGKTSEPKTYTFEEIDAAAKALALLDGLNEILWTAIDESDRYEYRLRAQKLLIS